MKDSRFLSTCFEGLPAELKQFGLTAKPHFSKIIENSEVSEICDARLGHRKCRARPLSICSLSMPTIIHLPGFKAHQMTYVTG